MVAWWFSRDVKSIVIVYANDRIERKKKRKMKGGKNGWVRWG